MEDINLSVAEVQQGLPENCSAPHGLRKGSNVTVCLSVCPSVTFRYHDHTDCNTSKIISRTNSLRHLLTLTTTCASPPKLGWKRGGVRSTKNPAISPKRYKIGPRLLWRTNRKLHVRFQLVPKSMTLNGRNITLAEIKKITKPTRKIWTKIDSYYQRQNVGCWF